MTWEHDTMSIFGLRIGGGVTVASGITIASQLPPNQGETFTYSRGTYINLGPNRIQSGITTTVSLPNLGGSLFFYQLCYAWQNTTVTGVGMNCYQALSARNGPLFGYAVGQTPNNLDAITPNSPMAYDTSNRTFTAGQFVTPQSFVGGPNLAAGTYFLVVIAGFPGTTVYDRSQNSTALVAGQPFVTLTNMMFYSTASSPNDGSPTQVGGTAGGYVFREGSSIVASLIFP